MRACDKITLFKVVDGIVILTDVTLYTPEFIFDGILSLMNRCKQNSEPFTVENILIQHYQCFLFMGENNEIFGMFYLQSLTEFILYLHTFICLPEFIENYAVLMLMTARSLRNLDNKTIYFDVNTQDESSTLFFKNNNCKVLNMVKTHILFQL